MTDQEAVRILQALTFNIARRKMPKDLEIINMALEAVNLGVEALEIGNREDNSMNQRDLDVLNVLWSTDEPMTAIDIANERKELTQSTVTAVLRKLLKVELIQIEGVTHSGKVLSRTYRPTEASKTAILDYFTKQYASFSNVFPPETLYKAIKDL